ncbi:hypothetical protein [Actinoplanes sp. URMC 104]|uniref:hypothetical protein n=1 Tax=Actinoplanes sp. URMC 104 TaxID=3423409 RepID=UPI003F1968C6
MMREQLDLAVVSDLFRAVLTGLPIGSTHQDRAYSLTEVSQRTGFAESSLVKDCRAGRLAHVHYGDFRGMTPLQVAAMLQHYSTAAPVPTGVGVVDDDELSVARAQSLRAANRATRRSA